MFDKFLDGINWMRDIFSFDDYLGRLWEPGVSGRPSAEEARTDYQAIERGNSLLAYW